MKKLLLFVFLPLAFLGGCGPADRPLPADRVRIGISSNPGSLDPALMVDVVSGRVGAMLFNGLVRYSPDSLEVVPDLAESWDLSPDGRTYRFYLRPDARFTNGRTVSARDFKYSFERVLRPDGNSPRVWVLDRIRGARAFMDGRVGGVSGIRAVSDTELVLELDSPFEPFLHLLGMPAAYVVPREEVEREGADFGFRPTGTGPFALKSWKQDNSILLVRNDDYFAGPARTREIVFRVMPEEFSMRTEFEAGNLDIIPAGRSLVAAYRNSLSYRDCIVSGNGANTYYVGFNCARAPFDRPGLRRALNGAIERGKIIRAILEDTAEPARGPVPPMFSGALGEDFAFNPEAARAAVEKFVPAAAGREFSFYISTDEEALSIAQVLVHFLGRAGLRCRIVQREWGSFKKAVNEGEADMFLLSWWADYPSAENFLYPVFHSANLGSAGNRARFRDAEFDRLIEAARGAGDSGENPYGPAQKYIIDKAPWIFLWHKNSYFAVRPDIAGFAVYPVYNMDKGTSVRRKVGNGEDD